LNARQKAIWREVVASEDPNFFNSAVLRGLLADYCQRRAMGEEITSVIANAGEDWAQDDKSVAQRDKLLRMRDRETKAVADLATKLRLTNQSRYVPHAAARAAAKAPKEGVPWAKSA